MLKTKTQIDKLMHFPKFLFDGYQKLKACALVSTKKVTPETMKEFEDLLNGCQPKEKIQEYSLIKDLYNTNRHGYTAFVRGNSMECSLMWTESKTIVNWFRLRNIVYLSYDRTSGQYKVEPHRGGDGSDRPTRSDIEGQEIVPRPTKRVDLGLDQFPGLMVRAYKIPLRTEAPIVDEDEIIFSD